MPYITEEIYQLYYKTKEEKKSIHVSDWPTYNEKYVDLEAEKAGDYAVEIISMVRKHKSSNQLSLKTELSKLIIQCSIEQRKYIEMDSHRYRERSSTQSKHFQSHFQL